jgi:hypothetical protein
MIDWKIISGNSDIPHLETLLFIDAKHPWIVILGFLSNGIVYDNSDQDSPLSRYTHWAEIDIPESFDAE